jgi:hypothetical protein
MDKEKTIDTTDITDTTDIIKLVDFCDTMTSSTSNSKNGKVVHETDCIMTKYPYYDLKCNCFRHNPYVVHGKWFFEK